MSFQLEKNKMKKNKEIETFYLVLSGLIIIPKLFHFYTFVFNFYFVRISIYVELFLFCLLFFLILKRQWTKNPKFRADKVIYFVTMWGLFFIPFTTGLRLHFQ